MRKIVLSVAAASAALVAASPAAAQYRPGPPPAPYGYDNGFRGGDWRQVRELRMRIDNIERQIRHLDRRDAIRGRTADRLLDEANRIDRRLRDRARGGLDPREAGDIQFRVQRLEQRVQWAAAGRWDRIGDRW